MPGVAALLPAAQFPAAPLPAVPIARLRMYPRSPGRFGREPQDLRAVDSAEGVQALLGPGPLLGVGHRSRDRRMGAGSMHRPKPFASVRGLFVWHIGPIVNWISYVWTLSAGVCLTLAVIHLVIWLRRRSATANLLFALAALGAALNAFVEMWMLKTTTVSGYADTLRASFVPIAILVVSMVWYVRNYFGVGRRPLAVAVTACWALVLAVDAFAPHSPVFSEISGLQVTWTPWGERLAVVRGAISPWHNVIHLANIALFVFVADAAISLWRRGGRRQAAWMAAGIAAVFLVAVLQDQLLDVGFERIPYMMTFVYLVMVAALGYPLTASVVREMEMARRLQASEAELRESQKRAIRAAAAAERAEERFRLVVEGASSAMVMVDPEGRITLVNARTEAVFGYPREELIGVPIETLIPGGLRSEEPGRPDAQSAGLGAGAPGAHQEQPGRRKNGEEVPLDVGLTPIRSSEGVFTLASILDITERKRSELELARQRDEMAHLSRAAILGELSGSLAHELNQPLSAILSNAQAAQRFMARDPSNLEEVREILKDIVEQDKLAGEVIRRLRLLLTKGEVNLQTLDLSEVILDVAKLVRNDLAHQGVTMSTDLAPDLPPVRGDRVQVQQVLLNLVMNGCDAMADVESSQRLLAVRAGKNGGGLVQVSVADRGCGISPEEFPRLFEPFFTTKSKGLGLGLAVCRSIVEAHEGRLWAENDPGGGATFHFTLPAAGEAA